MILLYGRDTQRRTKTVVYRISFIIRTVHEHGRIFKNNKRLNQASAAGFTRRFVFLMVMVESVLAWKPNTFYGDTLVPTKEFFLKNFSVPNAQTVTLSPCLPGSHKINLLYIGVHV